MPIIRQTTSPTPISQTPGHLSRAISRQVVKEVKPVGSTYSVQRHQAMEAKALHKSAEAL